MLNDWSVDAEVRVSQQNTKPCLNISHSPFVVLVIYLKSSSFTSKANWCRGDHSNITRWNLNKHLYSPQCFCLEDGTNYQEMLLEMTGQKSVPNVFINKTHVGGCDKTLQVPTISTVYSDEALAFGG